MPPPARLVRLLTALGLLLPFVVLAVPVSVLPAHALGADLVLPARYPAFPLPLRPVGASSTVTAFTLQDWTTGRPTATYVKVAQEAQPRRFDGLDGVGVAGPFVLLVRQPDRGAKTYSMLDTRTWTTRPVDATFPNEPRGPLADGGWFATEQTPGYVLVRHAPDGTVTSRVPLSDFQPRPPIGDERGVVLIGYRSQTNSVLYVDWTSRRVSTLHTVAAPGDGSPIEPLRVALSPQYVAFAHGTTIVRRTRGTLTTTSTRALAKLTSFAITDAATCWLTSEGTIPSTASVWTSKESSPGTVTRAASGLTETHQWATPRGTGFVVVAGATSRTRGLYPVTPGATSLGAALAVSPPTAPDGLLAGPGRVLFNEPQVWGGRYRTSAQGVEMASDGPRLRGGEQVVVPGPYARGVELAGGLVAVPQDLGTTYRYAVLDRGTEIAAVGTGGYLAGLSGSRAVVVEGTATDRRSRVVDVRSRPERERVFPGTSDLDGSSLVTMTSDGAVDVRDLDLPDAPARSLRAATPPPADGLWPSVAAGGGVAAAGWKRVDGAWVGTSVLDVTTGREVSLPAAADSVQVAGGRAAYLDVDDRDVHVLDLATGLDTVVGAEPARPIGRALLGLAPDFVAWVDADGRTVVHQLDAPTGAPVLLGGDVPTAFGRAGLRVRLEVDRPVDSVQLTVTDSLGRVVAAQSSSAPDGGIRAVWNTRLADGSLAPPGQYAWRVTAVAGGRPLLATTGTPLSGTATLDVTSPDVRASAPSVASDVSTSPAFRVGWASSDSTAVFDVTVSARGHQADGSYGWAPPRYWKRGVAAGSAVYGGSGLPYAPKGLMRLVISSRDAAGNRTSVTKDVLVPADDSAWPQQLSAGWARVTGSGLYGGGAREATAAGRTVTVRATTNRVLIVGSRCTSCGRFSLLVDGRVVRTVDTYGARAARQRLLDLRLTGAPAAHVIVLRVAGTSGRPRVQLDALGLVT